MCEGYYRDREGALTSSWLGCESEIDVLYFRAEQRCWEGRVLVHVQQCLLGLSSLLDMTRRRRAGECGGHSSAPRVEARG